MLTVEVHINASIEKVWDYFTNPNHIIHWYFASQDWHVTAASNDLQIGGKFSTSMAAKDCSFGFDFEGIYTQIIQFKEIAYTLLDDRKVIIKFDTIDNKVKITESFAPETKNSLELQQAGWQAILNNFKKYVEEITN